MKECCYDTLFSPELLTNPTLLSDKPTVLYNEAWLNLGARLMGVTTIGRCVQWVWSWYLMALGKVGVCKNMVREILPLMFRA